jgi:thiol:disulfide interchange protein
VSADGGADAEEELDMTKPWATDLTEAEFVDAMRARPDGSLALVELYASWCPACRAFKPHYERVAHALSISHPSVLVARADCATEVRHMRQLLQGNMAWPCNVVVYNMSK